VSTKIQKIVQLSGGDPVASHHLAINEADLPANHTVILVMTVVKPVQGSMPISIERLLNETAARAMHESKRMQPVGSRGRAEMVGAWRQGIKRSCIARKTSILCIAQEIILLAHRDAAYRYRPARMPRP
jgi:hypothetical protein